MHARMKALMDAEGLPYSPRSRTYNTRLAQELGAWGDAERAPAIHDALFRAYFVDGLDLSQPAELIRVAESVGLSAAKAGEVLSQRTFRAAVDEDWAHARQLGITGVPTFVIGDQGVVGAQPYAHLERFVRALGIAPVAR